jgi:hypothetical protein
MCMSMSMSMSMCMCMSMCIYRLLVCGAAADRGYQYLTSGCWNMKFVFSSTYSRSQDLYVCNQSYISYMTFIYSCNHTCMGCHMTYVICGDNNNKTKLPSITTVSVMLCAIVTVYVIGKSWG